MIAKSFARIFFRNSINNGLLLIESDLYDHVQEGDTISVEPGHQIVHDGVVYPISLLPQNPDGYSGSGRPWSARCRSATVFAEEEKAMGHTLIEKIIMRGTGEADVRPGQIVTVGVDRGDDSRYFYSFCC